MDEDKIKRIMLRLQITLESDKLLDATVALSSMVNSLMESHVSPENQKVFDKMRGELVEKLTAFLLAEGKNYNMEVFISSFSIMVGSLARGIEESSTPSPEELKKSEDPS